MKERALKLFYKWAGIGCNALTIPAAVIGIVTTIITEVCQKVIDVANEVDAEMTKRIYIMDICDTEARTE